MEQQAVIPMSIKIVCNKCNKEKDEKYFHRKKHNSNGRDTICIECVKERKLSNPNYRKIKVVTAARNRNKNRYELSKDEYILLLETYVSCAICGKKPEGKNLCVDHDHETKKVRGLLCNRCNLAIGLMKDDVEILFKAINYLSTHKKS